jgi:hypothetical protein
MIAKRAQAFLGALARASERGRLLGQYFLADDIQAGLEGGR